MDTENTASATPAATDIAAGNPTRRRRLLALGGIFATLGVAYGVHWGLVARYQVETDNAYVQGNVVQITPQIAGTVLQIAADDTDFVRAGQPLVKLDPADAQVALDQAEAQLAQTVREVRTTFANNGTLSANIAVREAEVARAQADVMRAEDDVARRQPLIATGAVAKEEMQHSLTALENSRSAKASALAALAAAREQLTSNESLTEGTTVENHPSVQRAAARVREAYLALARSEIPAPVTGYIAKRSVQIGQRVQAGAPLMAVIPLDQVWVDANFKEAQLRAMRIGQPVTLTADMYGQKVEYHGTLAGLGAGTGAAFSLLPAQNATGNWIKVVQRVPVRVELDAKELAQHPLRVGLSMLATVDVHDQSGRSLAEVPRTRPVAQTPVFDGFDQAADAAVANVVSANLGRKASVARVSSHAALVRSSDPLRLAATH